MARSILLVGAALISASISPLNAEASEARWCAVISRSDGDVHWDCTYRSIEECRPNVIASNGNRSFCTPSPYYVANPPELRNSRPASQMSSKTTTAIKITPVKPKKVAIAAKPAAAKPRSETEPVEEKKANSLTITEPEVPPSTQPLATPDPVPKKEPTTIGGKTEGPASGQPAETSGPVPRKEPTTVGGKTEGASSQPAETSGPVLNKETTAIGGKAEGPATGQPSETSDPVLKKAKIMVAAKMEDPTYAEFVDMKSVMRNNSFGEPFEIICGHVKGKMKSGEATGERPFLYLVKEDEAFIVGGNPDSMAAIVYRAQCVSANSR